MIVQFALTEDVITIYDQNRSTESQASGFNPEEEKNTNNHPAIGDQQFRKRRKEEEEDR